MKAIKIDDGIHWIGASISTNDLFEGIWPIPDGVTLNSYVVKGEEKTAIIDLVGDWGNAPKILINELESVGVKIEDIDYLILNHIEPDHTGDLRKFFELTKKAQIITSKKGKPLVEQYYCIPEDAITVVGDGDTLDLGGRKLDFFDIPNVHWPETMATYDKTTKTLFSCDAFGSYGSLIGSLFDDENSAEQHKFFQKESLRYYANIVGPFSNFVIKAINKIVEAKVEINTICPSHGLVWRGNPMEIIKRYQTYANYMKDFAEPKITVVWGSMYGNTEIMLQAVLRGIAKEKVPVEVFRVPQHDNSYILSSVWESAGLVFGMPTYEYKMYPPMSYTLDLIAEKRAQFKKVLRFGSYGWSGGAQKVFDEKTAKLKWDIMNPLEFQGTPSDEDLELGEKMGQELAQQVKAIPAKLLKICD